MRVDRMLPRFGKFVIALFVTAVSMFQVGGHAAPMNADLIIENPAWWQLDRLDQPTGLDGTYSYANDGHGVTIYILDNAVRTSHSEFGGRAVAGPSFSPVEDDCPPDNPKDPIEDDPDHGTGSESEGADSSSFGLHGTFVASLAAGHIYGVAKGATIVSVPVMNRCERTYPSSVISALEWVIGDAASRQTRAVVNMSFVLGGVNDPSLVDVHALIDSAVNDHNIVVVAGAGNDGQDAGGVAPGGFASVIAVGGSSQSDTRWTDAARGYSSSFGSAIALFAPAENLIGASYTGDTDYSPPQEGTSGAAPLVAGLIARFLQARPSATPAEVREQITSFTNAPASVDDGDHNSIPLANTHFIDLLSPVPGDPGPTEPPTTPPPSWSEDSAVRQCSNYVEEDPVYEPDTGSCLTWCQGAGADSCEWNANSGSCYVEFGQGCVVEGGHGAWWAVVLDGTVFGGPASCETPSGTPPMSTNSGVRECSNYAEQPQVFEPTAAACVALCQGAGADACEWDAFSGDCFVESGQGCAVEGGHNGWCAAVLDGSQPSGSGSSGGDAMSENTGVRECSNYSEEDPVYQPDPGSCLSLCEGEGADACEWSAGNGDCFVEFGQGCVVEDGHNGWWAEVLGREPTDAVDDESGVPPDGPSAAGQCVIPAESLAGEGISPSDGTWADWSPPAGRRAVSPVSPGNSSGRSAAGPARAGFFR